MEAQNAVAALEGQLLGKLAGLQEATSVEVTALREERIEALKVSQEHNKQQLSDIQAAQEESLGAVKLSLENAEKQLQVQVQSLQDTQEQASKERINQQGTGEELRERLEALDKELRELTKAEEARASQA